MSSRPEDSLKHLGLATTLTNGNLPSTPMVCYGNTPTYQTHSSMGLTLASHPSSQPSPLPTTNQLTTSRNTGRLLWKTSSPRDDTLGPFLRLKSRRVLDPSSLPHSASSRSLADQANIVSFRTCPIQLLPKPIPHQLTAPLTLRATHAPGELLQSYPLSCTTFHQDSRPQYETSKKLIAQSRLNQRIGQEWSYKWAAMITLRLILESASGWHPVQGHMGEWVMLQQKFFGLGALGLFPNGWMTTSSSVFDANT